MKLHFYNRDTNFGDAINTWLWERLLPGCLDDDERVRFSGIGTVLNRTMPPAQRWIVFTSGVGYDALPSDFGSERWTVICVRGPLSAAALGLPGSFAVTDGAILLASLPEYTPVPEAERNGVVFVPHHLAELFGEWRSVAARAGVEHLSALGDSREVIARIRRAKLVLADSMHAAIVADAMRVPWIPVMTSPQICTFKWLDWTHSMQLQYAPVKLLPATLVSRTRNALLLLRGDNNAFEPSSPCAALTHLRRSNAIRQQAWWPLARRFGRGLSRRAERQLQMGYLAPWRRAMDESLLDRSAKVLAAAATGQSYLSDDSVFRSRLEMLRSRLESVRAAAAVPF